MHESVVNKKDNLPVPRSASKYTSSICVTDLVSSDADNVLERQIFITAE